MLINTFKSAYSETAYSESNGFLILETTDGYTLQHKIIMTFYNDIKAKSDFVQQNRNMDVIFFFLASFFEKYLSSLTLRRTLCKVYTFKAGQLNPRIPNPKRERNR